MAKRDLEMYVAKVAADYYNMLNELKDMEAEFQKGLISPEMFEQMQNMIEPIKRNYMTLKYVMFLLNKPKRAKKFDVFKKQNHKLLEGAITEKDVREENAKAMENLKNLFKS